jgi:hypothetical protein
MNKIVEIARKEAGYVETAGNKTKYGKWFGLDGVAWCAMFVSWCYFKANKQLPKIGFTLGFAGCQTGYEYFKKNGWITTTPVPGDIVLFDWNKDGRYDHTGIFEGWINATKFETIEGNTSPVNNSNGGQVMKRIRSKSVAIFVHPPLNV